jgi:acyl carrier protein
MLDKESLEKQVHQIIADAKKIDATHINNDTLLDDLDIGSLDIIVIISDIEQAFDVDVPDEIGHSIETVRDVVKALYGLLDE